MYPYKLFGDFDLYLICLVAGAAGALLLFRYLSERTGLSARVTNLALSGGVLGIALGYGAAVLFQAFYDFLATGEFLLNSDTGATFYGGLVGGILAFLAVYFGGGHFLLPTHEHIAAFPQTASLAACSITLAHACGRVGCFFAGCCHGNETDAWYGIYMPAAGTTVVPTQLLEALFLAALCAFLIFRALHGARDGFPLYMTVYGVFRFFFEYLRGDYRGASPVWFLTPSQFIALLMVAVGILLLLREPKKPAAGERDT